MTTDRIRRPRRRYRSHRDHIGQTRWKLFKLLRESGFSIPTPECFWMQEGAYRHQEWDLARWGADWVDTDEKGLRHHWSLHSWDTMTDCVRYGIYVHDHFDRDLPNHLQISSRKK